jgi:SHR-binding domain of vacuolar-sorting associated protein 13
VFQLTPSRVPLQVLTITPRFVLFNNTDEVLEFGQVGSKVAWQLPAGLRLPYHWDDAEVGHPHARTRLGGHVRSESRVAALQGKGLAGSHAVFESICANMLLN